MTEKRFKDLGPVNPETAKVILAAADMISKLELRVLKLERSRNAFKYALIGYVISITIYKALEWWLS